MQATEVLETCLYAEDLEAAEAFYTRVLGLKVLTRQENRHVFFKLDRSMFLVFNPMATRSPDDDFGPHGCDGAGHAAFTMTEAQIQPWRDRLAVCDVPIESQIDWPQGGHSIYFRDPAGNSIELATRKLWGFND